MPNFRAIKISIQKALNETTRKIETLVSILKKNPHLKKTTQKILGKKSRQRKFFFLKVNKRSCFSGTEPQVQRTWS